MLYYDITHDITQYTIFWICYTTTLWNKSRTCYAIKTTRKQQPGHIIKSGPSGIRTLLQELWIRLVYSRGLYNVIHNNDTKRNHIIVMCFKETERKGKTPQAFRKTKLKRHDRHEQKTVIQIFEFGPPIRANTGQPGMEDSVSHNTKNKNK